MQHKTYLKFENFPLIHLCHKRIKKLLFFEWLTDLLHLNNLLKMEIALLLLCSVISLLIPSLWVLFFLQEDD